MNQHVLRPEILRVTDGHDARRRRMATIELRIERIP